MKETERFFLELIRDGTLSVDSEGRIWRHYWIHYFSPKKIRLKIPRRAETDKTRYLRIVTFRNGKSIHAQAHRVVYIYFFGDVIDGLELDHKDCDKHNNCPGNLEPVTRKENVQRAKANGRFNVPHHITVFIDRRGEKAPMSKLKRKDVVKIRELLGKITQEKIARLFGVTRSAVSAISTGRSWKE